MTQTTLTPAEITSELAGTSFGLSAGQFTYSLPGAGSVWPGYAAGSEPFDGYAPFNATQGAAFVAALARWDELVAPNFTAVADTASSRGEVRIAFTAMEAGTAGYAYAGSPQPAGSMAGDVWISNTSAADAFAVGSYGFEVLLHELGHVLGLKHSFEAPAVPPVYDNARYTVMSYDQAPGGIRVTFVATTNGLRADSVYVVPKTPMVFDIAAVQSLYGADPTTRAGDTVYTLDQNEAVFQSLYDAGGSDTIDLGSFTRSNTVDLRPGAYSSVGEYSREAQIADWTRQFPQYANFIARVLNEADLYTGADNLGIAFSTTIENVVGGSGIDRITGNAAANVLSGGAGADVLDGGEGNDRLVGGTGADVLTGGAGADVFVLSSANEGADRITDFAAGDTIDLGGGRFTAVSQTGTGTLLTHGGGTVQIDGTAVRTLAEWNAVVVGASVASVAPALVRADPADGARGVPVVANLTLQFSGALARGSGVIVLAKADGTVIETFDAATNNRLTLSGNTLTIDPTRALDPASGYVLSVSAGAMSVAGTRYAGLSGHDFTTLAASSAASQAILLVPAGAAASVSGNATVFGVAGAVQDVTVLDLPGRIAFDGTFNTGGDRIRLSGVAADYTVLRNGASVEISDGDTVIAVPVGTGGADIVFGDGVRSLGVSGGVVTLGGQTLTTSPAAVTALAGPAAGTAVASASVGAILLVNAGSSASAHGVETVFGSVAGAEVVTVRAGATLAFDGSFNAGGDVIVLPGGAASYTVLRAGGAVTLNSASASVTIPVGVSGMAIRFDDGDRTLVFDAAANAVKLGGTTIAAGPAALPASPFTAASVDQDDDANLLTPSAISASGGNIHFSDDGAVAQNVAITGFGRGDVLAMSGDARSYGFSATGGDITITHVGLDGMLATTTLMGVADPAVYVNSEASAELAAGFDFATFVV